MTQTPTRTLPQATIEQEDWEALIALMRYGSAREAAKYLLCHHSTVWKRARRAVQRENEKRGGCPSR